MDFQLPPRIFNEKGEKRRVGFELEFGGLSLEETSRILTLLFGGSALRESDYVYRVHTYIGDFTLEADSNFLKNKKYEKYLKMLGLSPETSQLGHDIEEALSKLAGTLIPFEVVMPPLPIDNLTPVERIRQELQQNSAKGTKSSFYMPFGMQFNPEVPDFKSETLLSYLRGFFLLFDWLYEESDISIARRVAPFIHDFPEDYINLVLDPAYAPDLDAFMIDYLRYNSTRNRPLDLLPLFAFMDQEKVFSFPVEKELVKPRPTFHYRLPNSMVDDPHWSIAGDWNKWVEIENLANDQERLRKMMADYIETRDGNFLFVRAKWVEKTRHWLHS
jgi:hypothetical protein